MIKRSGRVRRKEKTILARKTLLATKELGGDNLSK